MVMSISCQRRFGQRKLFVHMSLVCLPSSDTEGCKKHECDILEQDKGTCVGDTIKIIGIQELAAIMTTKVFVRCVFAIFATNALFLRVIANLQI